MQTIIAALAIEHAREAALLWSLWDEEPDDELHERITLHLAGLRACRRRGADPLAGFDRPLAGADLFPAAWLGQVEAAPDDAEGRRAVAAAADFA